MGFLYRSQICAITTVSHENVLWDNGLSLYTTEKYFGPRILSHFVANAFPRDK
jgi:hypothetical protein